MPIKQLTEVPTRIAVTGSSGFLGRHALKMLAAKRNTEIILAIDIANPKEKISNRKIIHAKHDVRNQFGTLLAKHGIQVVYHLAYVVRPSRDRSWARSINVEGTSSLLRACSAADIEKVIYPSSATVYGARKCNKRRFTEQDYPNPLEGFQYSLDKIASENLLTEWQNEKPKNRITTILRSSVVMGVAANNFIIQALRMNLLPLPALQDTELQLLHISDFSDVLYSALVNEKTGVYNIAGSGTVSWKQMVRLFGNHYIPIPGPLLQFFTNITWLLGLQSHSPGQGVNFVRYPWLVSTEKIKRELGWVPIYTSKQALIAAKGSSK